MTKFKVTYEVEGGEFETVLKQVFTSLYLAEIDGKNVRLESVHPGGEVFSFPATQKLLKHLNEQPARPAEGDWDLRTDSKVGED